MDSHSVHHLVEATVAAAPRVVTDNTAVATPIIDCQGYDYITFLVPLGTLSDADTTLNAVFAHGDVVNDASNPSSITDTANVVAGDNLIEGPAFGTSAMDFADDGKCFKWTYNVINGKRWVQLTVTPVNNTGNIPIGIVALKHPRIIPAAFATS